MRVTWLNSGKNPQVAPNPNYPLGMDMDVSKGAERTCTAQLPYPAKGIGVYVVQCAICGYRAACTTAGRFDDPRSLKMACKLVSQTAN